MSDDQDEMTFEEAAELLEQAGDAATRDMLVDLLRDALSAVQSLSERVAVLEYRLKAKEGTTEVPWISPSPSSPPYTMPNIYKGGGGYYTSNHTSTSLREAVEKFE